MNQGTAATTTTSAPATGAPAPAPASTPAPAASPSFVEHDDFGTGIPHSTGEPPAISQDDPMSSGPEQTGEPGADGDLPGAQSQGAEGGKADGDKPAAEADLDDLDVLAQSLGLKPFTEDEKRQAEQPLSLADLDTPEKLAKAINPDGKATDKQQLENLQRLIGRQSSEVKQAREMAALANAYAPFLRQTASGQPVMDAVKLAQSLPPEVLQAQLADAGLTVIPTEHLAYAAQYHDYPPDVVDAVIADKAVPYPDKVAQIESDPKLAAKAEALKLQRQQTISREREVSRKQMFDTLDMLGKKYDGLFKELSAPLPDGSSVLQRFNAVLPPQLGGQDRATVMFLAAAGYHSLQPGTQRKMAGALRQHFEKQFAKKMRQPAMGGPTGQSSGSMLPDSTPERSAWGL